LFADNYMTKPIHNPPEPKPCKELFLFRLEILKAELASIAESIRKIDEIGNSIKNWAIVTWAGAIAVIIGRSELYGYVLFSAFIPLWFMLVDAHWRKIQRRLAFRQQHIGEYLCSQKFETSFLESRWDFSLLDPIARKSKTHPGFKEYISLLHILSFPTVSLLYFGLAIMSVVLAVTLRVMPPSFATSASPAPPANQAVPSLTAPNTTTTNANRVPVTDR
jgi:hypothetical protein